MTNEKAQGATALAERPKKIQMNLEVRDAALKAFANRTISDPLEYAAVVREWQDKAFIVGATSLGAVLPDGVSIMPMVVVIDPSYDDDGRGGHVYHQRSIHKDRKIRGTYYKVVSLNAISLKRILDAAGVVIARSTRISPARYIYEHEVMGTMLTIDGTVQPIGLGLGSVDASDGSPEIGGWTPEAWEAGLALAEDKDKYHINGWTQQRVLRYRQFARQIAATKAVNRLAYAACGVQHSYMAEELAAKPFIIMRPVYKYDMSDPVIKRMVTAARLQATGLLYPGAAPEPAASGEFSHAMGDVSQMVDGDVAESDYRPASPEAMNAVVPDEAQPFEDGTSPLPDTWRVLDVTYTGDKVVGYDYFATVQQGDQKLTLFTPDIVIARKLKAASKDGQPRSIPREETNHRGQTYLQALDVV